MLRIWDVKLVVDSGFHLLHLQGDFFSIINALDMGGTALYHTLSLICEAKNIWSHAMLRLALLFIVKVIVWHIIQQSSLVILMLWFLGWKRLRNS